MSSPEITNSPEQDSQSIEAPTQPNTVSQAAPDGDSQPTQAPTEASAVQERQAPPPPPVRAPYVSREERDRRRREALAGLVIGEWREGKVTGIAAFGAFVDLGGVDGLVHVSQLGTGGYVERVEDVVQVGQVVRVRVAEVDSDRGRVSLSMREPRPAPTASRDRPAPAAGGTGAPRPARPATGGFTPSWTPEAPPEQKNDRQPRRGERSFSNRQGDDQRPARRTERPRRGRGEEDEEWRGVRGDPRNFYSFSEESEDEPAPTTAEELVARFGRKDNPR